MWIACQSSHQEQLATDRLCDLIETDALVIEHSARTLRRRADRNRLVRQFHLHQTPGRRVLLVRRFDRLRAADQTRLCLWLSSGRPGADWIVATGRMPAATAPNQGLQRRVDARFRPGLQVCFDEMKRPASSSGGGA